MYVVDFETAKKLRDFFGIDYSPWSVDGCNLLYTNDLEKKIISWSSMEADYYLKNNNRFLPAPYIQEVFEYFETKYGISIYIVPNFDEFNNAQIGTYFEIYRYGIEGGKNYVSACCMGNKFESANRAIQEVCELLKDGILN